MDYEKKFKESEDENIRKAISYAIANSTHEDGILINGVTENEAIAWLEEPCGEGDVEYIRADVFMEKACKWFNNNFTNHNEDGIRGIISYSFDTEEEMLADLINYMKRE